MPNQDRYKVAMRPALLMGILTNIYIVIVLILVGAYTTVLCPAIGGVVFIVLFFLLKANKLNAQQTFLIAASIVAEEVAVHTHFLGWDSGFTYFMFLLPTVFLLNTEWKTWIVVVFLSAVGAETVSLYFLYVEGYSAHEISDSTQTIINTLNASTTGIVAIVVMVYFSKTIGKRDEALVKANADLEYERRKSTNLHNSIKDAFMEISLVAIMTPNWSIDDANQNFIEFVGMAKDEIYNLNLSDLINTTESVDEFESLRSSIKNGVGWTGVLSLSKADKTPLWIDVKAFVLQSDKFDIGKVWLIGKDITKNVKLEAKLKSSNEDLVESLKRKEFLLRELNHRVKNNLQFISGVLFLQVQNESDERLADSLSIVQSKITAINDLHDILVEKASIDSVDIISYLKAISTKLTFSAEYDGKVDIRGDNVKIATESAPYFGIVLNELMTNSLKYAWDQHECEKEIIIEINKVGGEFIFHYSDNGKGYDRDQISPGLGTKLFDLLMLKQFKAKFVDCDQHPNCQCYALGQEVLLI